MTFTQIKTFYLVATMGTFQKAADKLNTSQPTVSARIVALENWFGVRLFDRTSHRSQLTAQGRALLEIARRMLELEATALNTIGQKGQLQGIYRIGAADTLALSWLPSFMREIQSQHPLANFEFQIGASPKLRDELVKQSLDLCFMVGPVTEPNIVSLPLCETPVVIAASPELGLHGRKLSIQELAEHRVLTFERRTQTYQSFVRAFDAAGVIAKMSGTSSLSFAVALAMESYGIIAVPWTSINRELEDGRLVLLDSDFSPEFPKFAACYMNGPSGIAAQKIAQEAREHLAAHAVPGIINILD